MIDQQHKVLIAKWFHAWSTGHATTIDLVDAQLKGVGLIAYEDGDGLPRIGTWYNGPIEVGMKFIWNASSHVKVTAVTDAGVCTGTFWNDKTHFRMMVRPVSRKGVHGKS